MSEYTDTRFSSIDTEAEHGIIGNNSQTHAGMGNIILLVDLDRWMQSDDAKRPSKALMEQSWAFFEEGGCGGTWKCSSCGYDRAVFSKHTEVDASHLQCYNCGASISWGPDA